MRVVNLYKEINVYIKKLYIAIVWYCYGEIKLLL